MSTNYIYDMCDLLNIALAEANAAAQKQAKPACNCGGECKGEKPAAKKEQIPADLIKTDDKLTIQVAVPGKTKEDISVTSEVDSDGFYIVKINVKETTPLEGKYLQKKIKFVDGELPIRVTNKWDVNKAAVAMSNGLLTISIPLAEESKPKVFEIQ